jgi:hypothetical protein
MRVEGVPGAAACIEVEAEAKFRPARADAFLVRGQLRIVHAVLALEVLGHVHAFGRHVRRQFERLEVDVGRDLAIEALQGLFQRREPDGAPRADHVGDEVDAELDGCRHGHGDSGGKDRPEMMPVRPCFKRI